MKKYELLEKMDASRQEFELVLAKFTDERMLQPMTAGGWTPKDALAHIGWWERRARYAAGKVAAGSAPEYSLEEGDVDGVNQKAYDENRTRPLADIRAEEAEAYSELRKFTLELGAAELEDGERFAWTKGAPLSVVVEWNTFGHYEEHLPDLRRAAGA